ncbi:MAG TPA: HD domain-containing protein, partial [Rubrivivax sp.]|nr:HD domain-containing protein [Rubrivivax sp.]
GVPQRAEHHPEIDTGVHLMMVLDVAARLQAPLAVRFACLGHDLGKGTSDPRFLPRHHGHEQRSAALVRQVCERLRVPVDCKELADVVAREHGHVHASATLGAVALIRLFERCDALRRPDRFALLLQACECDARGRGGREEIVYEPARRLPPLLQVARSIDTAAVAALAVERGKQGPEIGAAVRQARVRAVRAALQTASDTAADEPK